MSASWDARTKAMKARSDFCRDRIRNTRSTWKGKKMTADVKIEVPWSRCFTNELEGLVASYIVDPQDRQLTAITKEEIKAPEGIPKY